MSLIITGIIDGPLTGGIPKAIEITVLADVADLSIYGIGSANNGGGTDGQEFTLSGSASAGDRIYISSESTGFAAFFGFAPTFTTGEMSVNGDDAIELFENGEVIDTFGTLTGGNAGWDYTDGWAYRLSGSPASRTFDAAQWVFSGRDALDGATSNATAATPVPFGSWSGSGGPVTDPVINEFVFDHFGADMNEYVELKGRADTDYSDLSFVVIEGDAGTTTGRITAVVEAGTTNAEGYWASDFLAGMFQNGSQTLLLVRDFTGAVGQYVDSDGDGSLDVTPWAGILDSVAVLDGGTGDVAYSGTVLAPFFDGMPFHAGGASRIPDGVDTDTVSDWMRNDFDRAGLAGFTGTLAPGEALNTPGAVNDDGRTTPIEVRISEIQGAAPTAPDAVVGRDDVSALAGRVVTVSAVVTADFQDGLLGSQGDLNGFFLQEEDADSDGNALTSEGIFVFDGSLPGVDVQVGDLVTVTGIVGEFFGETQINALMVEVLRSGETLPTAVDVTFPVASVMIDGSGAYVANLEAYEGMLVNLPQSMTMTDLFQLDRFGQYTIADQRYEQFTQSNLPDADGFDSQQRDVARGSLVLDDGLTSQNPSEIRVIDGNDGILTAADSFRMGDQLQNVTGVLNYAFNEFRIQNGTGDYSQQNTRPLDGPAEVGGNFKVASVNVLNYFTTIDTRGTVTDIGADPRGADTALEFERQAAKIVAALTEIDADVFGLVEIENDFAGEVIPVADLVARMNAAVGDEVYGWVDPGQEFVGTDAIANALIYRVDRVALVGEMAILTKFGGESFLDPLSTGSDKNRAAIAQTFEDIDTGERLTVSVNHLKSKGSADGFEGEADGQGNSAATRLEAARILDAWLDSDPTGQGAENRLVVGDLNSYAMEDPIRLLEAAGWTDLGRAADADAYSYVFDGQIGTLDYAMANDALLEHFTGATEWHVNADEALALDYDLSFRPDATLWTDNATRYSDHDPVVAGFAFYYAIDGTGRRDVIAGTDAWDDIRGGRGNDTILAGAGNDLVRAGAGNDRVFGGEGDDLLQGGLGNDSVRGGAGRDTILMGEGRLDQVWGGADADTFAFAAALATDGERSRTFVEDYEAGLDVVDLDGVAIGSVRETADFVDLVLAGDGDVIRLWGVDDIRDVLLADPLVA